MLRRVPLKPGKGFKAKPRRHEPAVEREPKPLAKATRRGVYAGTVQPVPKQTRKTPGSRSAETAHKEKLADLGCMVCRRLFPGLPPGPVELHHLREGGWGKGGYLTLMPLCPEHHRGDTGVHGLGTRGFVKHYGFTQADLLRDALALVEKEKS